MDIWTTDKLVLFLIFVIPGFIALKAYELISPSNQKDSSKQLIDVIVYSCINYAILFIPIAYIEFTTLREENIFLYYLFYLFVFIGLPIALAFLWKKLRESEKFQNIAPHPENKPWDYVFSQRKEYFIKAVLKNGNVVGGFYSKNSFSSSSPTTEQIYLEQSWVMKPNGGFERVKNDTNGILIMQNQISFLEFKKHTKD